MKPLLAFYLLLGLWPVQAAINPERYQSIASDAVRLRQIARIVTTDREPTPTWRRVTLVAEVLAVKTTATSRVRTGDTLVIDYTVDLTALKTAQEQFAAKGAIPGPQFLHEPEPPALNAKNEFVAYLAPVATRLGNVNRYAGAIVDYSAAHFTGPVFVPVAAQYSFALP